MTTAGNLTYDEFLAGLAALQSRNVKPTIRALRDQLTFGSHTTITKYFQKWKSSQPHDSEPEITIPADLQKGLIAFVRNECSTRLARVTNDLAEQEQLVGDLTSENERQQVEIDRLNSVVNETENGRSQALGQLVQMQVELNDQRHLLLDEQQRNHRLQLEMALASARLEGLSAREADIAQRQTQLESAAVARSNAEARAELAGKEATALTARIAELRAQLNKETQVRFALEERLVEATLRMGERRGSGYRPSVSMKQRFTRLRNPAPTRS